MQEILLNNDFYIDLIPRHLNEKPAEVRSVKGAVTSHNTHATGAVEFEWQGQDNDGCKRQSDGSFRLFFDKKIVGNFGEGQLKAELDYTLPSTVFEGGIRAVHDALDLPFTMVKKHSPGYKGEPMVGNSVFLFHLVVDSVKGEPGESAYQAAIEGGYLGTEQKFNTTLGSISTVRYDVSEWQLVNQKFPDPNGVMRVVKSRFVQLFVDAGVSGDVAIPMGIATPPISVKGYASEIKSNQSLTHNLSSFNIFAKAQDNPSDYGVYINIPRTAAYGWRIKMCIEALSY